MTASRYLTTLLSTMALAAALLGLPVAATQLAAGLFTSLEEPPTPAEVRDLAAKGVGTFEFDLDSAGAVEATGAVKAVGGRITAYHIGGGGGRAWGSVKAGEFVRAYDTPAEFAALTEDVRRLVALGADLIHFDNTHRFSGKRLEAIADAIRAGGAGFIAKNNADKWRLVMERRPDLVPAYALVEDAMFDADETQAAAELAGKGVKVYVIGFRKPLDKGGQAVSDDYARAYKAANPWSTVLLIDDEARFDSRTARFY